MDLTCSRGQLYSHSLGNGDTNLLFAVEGSLNHTHRRPHRHTETQHLRRLIWIFCKAGNKGLGQTRWYHDQPIKQNDHGGGHGSMVVWEKGHPSTICTMTRLGGKPAYQAVLCKPVNEGHSDTSAQRFSLRSGNIFSDIRRAFVSWRHQTRNHPTATQTNAAFTCITVDGANRMRKEVLTQCGH